MQRYSYQTSKLFLSAGQFVNRLRSGQGSPQNYGAYDNLRSSPDSRLKELIDVGLSQFIVVNCPTGNYLLFCQKPSHFVSDRPHTINITAHLTYYKPKTRPLLRSITCACVKRVTETETTRVHVSNSWVDRITDTRNDRTNAEADRWMKRSIKQSGNQSICSGWTAIHWQKIG